MTMHVGPEGFVEFAFDVGAIWPRYGYEEFLCRGSVVSAENTDVDAASGKYITELGCDLG